MTVFALGFELALVDRVTVERHPRSQSQFGTPVHGPKVTVLDNVKCRFDPADGNFGVDERGRIDQESPKLFLIGNTAVARGDLVTVTRTDGSQPDPMRIRDVQVYEAFGIRHTECRLERAA